MGHELTEVGDGHAFVYNKQFVYPWHRLGVPFDGSMTPEQALELSHSNDHVDLRTHYVYDNAGQLVPVPNSVVTFSDIHGPMGTVGMDWQVMQCKDIIELAFAIVGNTGNEAHVETMGRLGEHGERFFAHIEFPELVLDPLGVADTIRRGLFVGTSFNSSMANIMGLSNVVAVCANTVRMALSGLQQVVRVKHTRNADEHMVMAAAAVGYAAAAEQVMLKRAEEMLRIPGGPAIDAVLDTVWPITDDLKGQWLERREETREQVFDLYTEGELCSPRLGENGWAAYNALTEWVDHWRPVSKKHVHRADTRRAEQALMDETHTWNAAKVRAADAIFALAS